MMDIDPKPLEQTTLPQYGEEAPPIFVVSSSMGSLGERIARTVLPQFQGIYIPVIIKPRVQHENQIEQIIVEVVEVNGTIIHTIADPDLRHKLIELAEAHDVVAHDAVGPLLNHLQAVTGREPIGKPGLFRELNETYFKRIEAIEFTLAHDDGKNFQNWDQAEIVLTGLSRVGKTPLSLYLSMLGWKVANIPIVPSIPPRPELFDLDPRRVVGLKIDPSQLMHHRAHRQRNLGPLGKTDYYNLEKLYEESDEARKIFRRGGFRTLDVTNKPIETTAGQVIQIVTRRLKSGSG
ncbi:MAG: kinase/pyrophosphorylase [Anaerolineae bacterium]|nr:kinase/pyrophosphorylase [Anaerolineae bacterium]